MGTVAALNVTRISPPLGTLGKACPSASFHSRWEHRLAKQQESGGRDLGCGLRDMEDTGWGSAHGGP